jgi:hypothetical protein
LIESVDLLIQRQIWPLTLIIKQLVYRLVDTFGQPARTKQMLFCTT